MGRVDVRAWAVWQGFVVDSGTGIRDGQVGVEGEEEAAGREEKSGGLGQPGAWLRSRGWRTCLVYPERSLN